MNQKLGDRLQLIDKPTPFFYKVRKKPLIVQPYIRLQAYLRGHTK